MDYIFVNVIVVSGEDSIIIGLAGAMGEVGCHGRMRDEIFFWLLGGWCGRAKNSSRNYVGFTSTLYGNTPELVMVVEGRK